MKFQSLLGSALLLILVGVAFYTNQSYFSDTSSPKPFVQGTQTKAVNVITQPVTLKPNNRIYEAIGNGRAHKGIHLQSPVQEEVQSILFEAGQVVQKGQVLIQLDDEEEKLAVQLAHIQVQEAQSLYARFQNAIKEGAVPQSDVDSAKARLSANQVRHDQAIFELSKRKIRAPFSGIVGIPQVDVGERISPNTLIATLDDESSLFIDFEVPEYFLSQIKTEESIQAQTPAFPLKTFEGQIIAIGNRVDVQSRTVVIRAQILNQEHLLKPGMSFVMKLLFEGSDYPSIPEISLQWSTSGSYVWIVQDEKAKQVFVKVVARSGGYVLVEGDLKPNDLVVVEGVQRLREGTPVTNNPTPLLSKRP